MLSIDSFYGTGVEKLLNYVSHSPNCLIYVTPKFMRLIAYHLNAQPGQLVANCDGVIIEVSRRRARLASMSVSEAAAFALKNSPAMNFEEKYSWA